MRSPRSVTMVPMPAFAHLESRNRLLSLGDDRLLAVICPVHSPPDRESSSSAWPRPCHVDHDLVQSWNRHRILQFQFFQQSRRTSFSNFARSRGRSLALWCACAGFACSCENLSSPSFPCLLPWSVSSTSSHVSECKKLLAVSSLPLAFYLYRCVRLISYRCCQRHRSKLKANG